MSSKRYLVTGGTGFLGSALVRRLLHDGQRVRVLDNNSRGRRRRLADVDGEFEFVEADIRDVGAVTAACRGVDAICHLAYVNGTEFFYTRPAMIVDIAVNGMLSVLHAARDAGVAEFILASSSEVYQNPPVLPSDETVPLIITDLKNPRCSYGGGKIACELLAMHYGSEWLERLIIFRPHNVYGADMGWEHVMPQFILRMLDLAGLGAGAIDFPIQGSGEETRAFVHVDDFTEGLAVVLAKGEHQEIYHLGNDEEVSIGKLACEIGRCYGRAVRLVSGPLLWGSPSRRCPDISKVRRLGYEPRIPLRQGLPPVVEWYRHNAGLRDLPVSQPLPVAA